MPERIGGGKKRRVPMSFGRVSTGGRRGGGGPGRRTGGERRKPTKRRQVAATFSEGAERRGGGKGRRGGERDRRPGKASRRLGKAPRRPGKRIGRQRPSGKREFAKPRKAGRPESWAKKTALVGGGTKVKAAEKKKSFGSEVKTKGNKRKLRRSKKGGERRRALGQLFPSRPKKKLSKRPKRRLTRRKKSRRRDV